MNAIVDLVQNIMVLSLLGLALWAGFVVARTACGKEREPVTPTPTQEQDRPAIRRAEMASRRERFGTRLELINMGAIVEIESGGNPKAVSKKGCRGLCQIRRGTWDECVERMGVTWAWDDAFDPGCNRAVGNYYMNTRIPQMLDHFEIADTVAARIAAYNWGIGHLLRAWRAYGHDWPAYAPQETKEYLGKYIAIINRQPTGERRTNDS